MLNGLSLEQMRREYRLRSLSETDVDPNPIRQFMRWMGEAVAVRAEEPNAMTLATCTRDGQPSARIVLLKQVDERGFAFYTNYLSRKGIQLDDNPRAALVFYWPELERQVRIEGDVIRTSDAESDHYFATRPLESRIGAAASPQSTPVDSRAALDERFEAIQRQYPDGQIPRPPYWGGYRVRPARLEFWQGRTGRMHDRIEYVLEGPRWLIRRLAP